jgi:hypothetical protein
MFYTAYRPLGSIIAFSFLALTAFGAHPVSAHQAPSGWTYPFSCCSTYDCRMVTSKSVSERPEGYVIAKTGEIIGYKDKRIKYSPDGDYHWCSVAGADNSRTICLFVPPRSF